MVYLAPACSGSPDALPHIRHGSPVCERVIYRQMDNSLPFLFQHTNMFGKAASRFADYRASRALELQARDTIPALVAELKRRFIAGGVGVELAGILAEDIGPARLDVHGRESADLACSKLGMDSAYAEFREHFPVPSKEGPQSHQLLRIQTLLGCIDNVLIARHEGRQRERLHGHVRNLLSVLAPHGGTKPSEERMKLFWEMVEAAVDGRLMNDGRNGVMEGAELFLRKACGDAPGQRAYEEFAARFPPGHVATTTVERLARAEALLQAYNDALYARIHARGGGGPRVAKKVTRSVRATRGTQRGRGGRARGAKKLTRARA